MRQICKEGTSEEIGHRFFPLFSMKRPLSVDLLGKPFESWLTVARVIMLTMSRYILMSVIIVILVYCLFLLIFFNCSSLFLDFIKCGPDFSIPTCLHVILWYISYICVCIWQCHGIFFHTVHLQHSMCFWLGSSSVNGHPCVRESVSWLQSWSPAATVKWFPCS